MVLPWKRKVVCSQNVRKMIVRQMVTCLFRDMGMAIYNYLPLTVLLFFLPGKGENNCILLELPGNI